MASRLVPDVATGKRRRAELLTETAIGLAGIAAESRFGFGRIGAADCVVTWRFTQGQLEDFAEVHELVDEIDPLGTQDVFFRAWNQAMYLVDDQAFWVAIETLAAARRHGKISREEVARIVNRAEAA